MNGKETFGPIPEPHSLQAMALEYIRDAILEGKLPPGTPLRIANLASELGMSPIPVREALQVLATEGLAVHMPRRGMIVSSLTVEDVANTYDVMGVLEGLAAYHVAGHLSPDCLSALQQMLAEMEAATARGDQEALLRLDLDFHGRICDAYTNHRAHEFLRQIWNYTYRVRRVYPRSEERLHETLGEHRALVAALATGDGRESERLVRHHIDGARDDLLRLLHASEPKAVKE